MACYVFLLFIDLSPEDDLDLNLAHLNLEPLEEDHHDQAMAAAAAAVVAASGMNSLLGVGGMNSNAGGWS